MVRLSPGWRRGGNFPWAAALLLAMKMGKNKGRAQTGRIMHHMPMPVHPPHPVQLTDDAASKETQYLRRRCTNCSQTEPPSWRRSTLNPGKIVCNKCGLYERTHLRPRPLRFDELRAGNKSRKSSKGSPKARAKGAQQRPLRRAGGWLSTSCELTSGPATSKIGPAAAL